jgi:TorA maturation chaperone TorD
VRSWYRRYGLVVDKLYVESDDHIGLEMIFAAQLATQALKVKEAGDLEKYETLVGAQREFLATHLLLWGAVWCNQVLKYARTDFYRGLAYAIRGAMAELGRVFEITVNFPREEEQAA